MDNKKMAMYMAGVGLLVLLVLVMMHFGVSEIALNE